MGDLLQKEGNTCGRRDHLMDKAGSNQDMGMVRARVDDSMEEHAPIDGDKRETGVSAIEG